MAVKTMTGAEPGQNAYERGWHTVTITGAKEGNWNDSKYLDVFFEGYNDACHLRIYERFNKETNEEFSIAKLFKFANAGIISVLEDQTGNKPVIQYDDDPSSLTGKKLNVLIVDDKKNDKYARVWDRVAPVTHVGEHLTYTDDDVDYWKKQAEDAYAKYGKPEVSNGAITDDSMPPESTQAADSTIVADDLPF